MGDERAPRLLRGEHVSADGGRGRRLLREAYELPVPRPRVPEQDPLVSRAAGEVVRARRGLPVRALGGLARTAARPRVHAGRQPHLLPGRPGCRGDGRRRRLLPHPVRKQWGWARTRSTSRPGPTSRWAPTTSGPWRRMRSAKRWTEPASNTRSPKAKAPSTGPRSTSTCATRSGACGRWRRSRSISRPPIASRSSTSTSTANGSGRS